MTAAATLTKGLIGIVIPGMVILAWIAITRKWSVLRSVYLPSGTALFLVVAAPWHVLVSLANPEFPWFYFVHEHFARFLTTIHHRSEPVWFFVPILLVGMFPWSAFFVEAVRCGLKNRGSVVQKYSDTLFLALWAGLVFAFFSMSGSKLATYILPAMPPLAILCGRYFADIWKRSSERTASYPYWFMALSVSLFSSALILGQWLASGNQKIRGFYAAIGPDVYLVVAASLAVGIVPLALKRLGNPRRGVVTMFTMTALMVLSWDVVVDNIDVTRTVKPLAMEIRRLSRPGDEVVSHLGYYQDLPDYVGHTVTVAGWKGELEFGTEQEDTSGWMIDEREVVSRLRHRTLYIITRDRNIERLKALAPVPLHEIMRNGRDVLVTNTKKIL